MKARAFLSRLSGQGPSDVRESVLANLELLLNARRGASLACEDFGIVDLVDLVHDFPSSAETLQRSIRDTLTQYEPRLRNVCVRLIPGEDPLRLTFEITARYLDGGTFGSLHLQSELDSFGHARIS